MFLSQQQYTLEILDRANMLHCIPLLTPADALSKSSTQDGTPFFDPSLYRILTGALQYVKLTRSTIVYVVQQICLFMHTPTTTHFQLVKTILRYIRGTSHFGLQLYRSSSLDLITYNDADWAGSLDTRKSMSGFSVFLGDNLVSWSSKRKVRSCDRVPKRTIEWWPAMLLNRVG
jgi:hypothetical protein